MGALHSAPASQRILIAADNPINQMAVTRALHCLGYEADVVGSGEAAVEAVTARLYTLVLLDNALPGKDACQTAGEIRAATAPAQRVPIIVLTAGELNGDRERYLAAGVDDYLVKPVRISKLAAALERWTRLPVDVVL
jgi:CheY-like chemotaxis protein